MREDGFGGEQAGSVLGGMRLRTHRKRENIHRVRMRCQLGLSRCKFHLNSINLLPPANEVWGKVMFLHMSVILSTGWRGSLYDVTSCPMFLLGGLCLWPHVTSGGVCPERVSVQGVSQTETPPTEERVVHILLECILVLKYFQLQVLQTAQQNIIYF